MNILVTNAWHDDNRGDLALVHSTIALLKVQYPNANITVTSMIPEGHKYWETAHQSITQKYPDITLVASPLPMEFSGIKLPQITRLIAAYLSIFAPFFSKFSGFNRYVKRADMIVSVGGHYLFSYNNNLKSLFRLLKLTQPFTLASYYKKPVILFSQSMGPYQGKLAYRVVKNVFSYAKCIVRESLSHELIKSLVPEANVEVKPDSAFYLSESECSDVSPVSSKNYAVFTLREPMKGDVEKVRSHFLKEMKATAEKLLTSGIVDEIYAFPHVTGPTVLEDDRKITQDFAELCDNKSVVLLNKPLNLSDTLALYRDAKFTIGTRFHSVVFSISQQTPAVAIAYYGPKAQGIMKYIGMEELCFDISAVTSQQLTPAVTKCLALSEQGEITIQKDKLTAELKNVIFCNEYD